MTAPKLDLAALRMLAENGTPMLLADGEAAFDALPALLDAADERDRLAAALERICAHPWTQPCDVHERQTVDTPEDEACGACQVGQIARAAIKGE